MGRFKKVYFYFRIVFALGFLSFLFYRIPFDQTIQAVRDASILLVVAAIFTTGTGIFLSAVKLQTLISLKNRNITFWSVIKAYYIGFFFNNFMPSDIGGDIFKINELTRSNLKLKDATSAVIIERLTGVLALIILASFLAMPGIEMFDRLDMARLQTSFLILVIMLFTFLIAAYTIWKDFIKRYLKQRKTQILWGKIYAIVEVFYVYRDNLRILFQALIISLAFHLLGAFNLLILTASVGNVLPFMTSLATILVVRLVSMVPISIGALGVKEGIVVFCLTKLGLALPAALGIALLLRLTIYIHSGVGGLLCCLEKKFS